MIYPMLDSFRSLVHGLFAKLLLGLLFASFLVWGVDDLVRNTERNVTIAEVGDAVITTDQFMRTLQSESENLRRMLGDNYSPEALRNMNVPDYVLKNMINRLLLVQESKDLGLIPSDVDVVRRIRNNPSFQDGRGNFDKAIFESMLRNVNMNEKIYVDQLREDMGINILLDALYSVSAVPDNAAQTVLEARSQQREIVLYALDASSIPALPQPTDEELKEYYDTHGAAFIVPEERRFSYVVLGDAQLPSPPKAEEAELKAMYEERLAELKTPETREVEQLLYASEAQAQKAFEAAKGVKSLVSIAEKTDALNKKNVAMGTLDRSSLLDGAAESVFSVAAGEVTPPVQTPFGWHVFKVMAINPEKTPTFPEIRPQLEKEVIQRVRDDALTQFVHQLEDAMAAGSTLEELAKEFKLDVKRTGMMNINGALPSGAVAKDLPDLDKFLETGFATEEKVDSSIVATKGGKFYILHVDEVSPEHQQDFEVVKAQVKSAWQEAEKLRRISEMAGQLNQELRQSESPAAVLKKYKLSQLGRHQIRRSSHLVADISMPPMLLADVFRNEPGSVTQAYLAGKRGYLIATLERVLPNTAEKASSSGEIAEIRRGLGQMAQSELMEQYTQYLRKKYPVAVQEDLVKALAN